MATMDVVGTMSIHGGGEGKTMRIIRWVSLLCFANVAQAVPILSGPITDPANGRQYYLLDKSTWSAAESQAVVMGGHLATVRNQAENDFIFNTFSH